MSDLQLAGGAAVAQKSARLYILSGDQQGREYSLHDRVTTIGRGVNNDVVIADPQTSRRHLEIVRDNGQYSAIDLGSANGFYINETQTVRATLKDGDIITIGLVRMAFRSGLEVTAPPPSPGNMATRRPDAPPPTMFIPELPKTSALDPNVILPANQQFAASITPPPLIDEGNLEHIDLRPRQLISMGREQSANDVLLDNPQVSRRHVQITNLNGQFTLSDLRSTNGTYVNGNRAVQPTVLNDGDLINIGPYRFMFSQGTLNRTQDDNNVRLDVLNLSKSVGKNQVILHNATFTILPREFVAIVGGSGTGKSTLLDAISGVRPATSGAVLYNKSNYYSQMDSYRSAIGYVPQDDIVPTELTVYRALYYAARLRLPQDTSDDEIKNRLEDVMDDLGLTERRDTPIHLLSGGQRKRVSIGAELISKPSLFFLDEPTSGLDPGLEGRMMNLLRKLADQGRTVVLITHATQNVEICDRVLFLAKGGYVAFYGSPADALTYFGTQKFAEIYNKLDSREASPEEWAMRFQNSPYYQKNVASRLKAIAAEAAQYGLHIEQNQFTANQTPQLPQVLFRPPRVQVGPFKQFGLLTRRYFEIMMSDTRNLLILLLQAPIIALMLVLVFRRDDWSLTINVGNFSNAKTLVFLLTIVAVWFGTSNAAREIVKEAAIYRRERRIGLKIMPYLLSKLFVQTLLIIVQIVVLLTIVLLGIGVGYPTPEFILYIFFTLLLTAFGGVAMGLLLSAINKNTDRVLSFVPLVLIPQIIFGGAVIAIEKMGAVGEFISNVMIARWSLNANGALTKLDNLPSARLTVQGPAPELAQGVENLFRSGNVKYTGTGDLYSVVTIRETREFNLDVYQQWLWMGIIILICLGLMFYFQKRKDKDYSR